APNANADFSPMLAALHEKARVYSRLSPRRSDLAVLLGAGQRHGFLGYRFQELFVAVGAPEALENQLRHFLRAKYGSGASQHDHFAQLDFTEQQLFVARTGAFDVDRWEDTTVGELTHEVDFHVARALKLL